jgi:ferrochelatase
MSGFDGVLLVGFGGPTKGCCEQRDPCPGEAHCFVDGVLGNHPARAARVAEVAKHYHELGGLSPFNELTLAQASALEASLRAKGHAIPVVCGFRHWRPYVKDVLATLAREGKRRLLAVIMAPHQSSVSWDWYVKVVAESLDALGKDAPEIAFLDPWWTNAGFVDACAERVTEALAPWEPARRERARLVFTAHAIPNAIARTAPYVKQFQETAALIAKKLGRSHEVAFQSGPSDASIPWTGPDVCDFLQERAAPGTDWVLAPIGFLCDNVEILYDLDVESRKVAEAKGSGLVRARTVGTHPRFIEMLASLVAARAS